MEAKTVTTGTPEEVALRLMEMVATAEGKRLTGAIKGSAEQADRAWIISTYRLCLGAVQHPLKPGADPLLAVSPVGVAGP